MVTCDGYLLANVAKKKYKFINSIHIKNLLKTCFNIKIKNKKYLTKFSLIYFRFIMQ